MGMDALGKLVSAEVRAMAGRKRWSAAALARELGWAQSYMARRWDGRTPFTPAELAQVARVLDVELDALLPAEASQVREVAGPEVLAALDVDQLERIAAALGVTVASLIPTSASATTAPASGAGDRDGARVLRFKPAEVPDSTYKSVTTNGHSVTTRPAEATRPPSGPRVATATRSPRPDSRRPRVSARLAGSRP